MVVTVEEFKSLSALTKPDIRNQYFLVASDQNCDQSYLTLDDVYLSIENISLSESVPDEIKSQFNVAKNLAVYSWFSYSFHQISDMKAYSAVEAALKLKLGKHKNGFKGLIKKAVNTGLIKDSGFRHISMAKNNVEYSRKLPDLMSKFRNNLAHGSSTLHPNSVTNL